MKKGIIFDMDGTLWDSSKQVAESWAISLKDQKIDKVITTEDMQNVMGKTMDKIADIFFPDREDRLDVMRKCASYENEYLSVHGGVPYPELEKTLGQLKEKYHLYIVSNCQSGYIESFLKYYNLASYFEDMECFGNNELPKGDNIKLVVDRNALTDAVYVGDIQGDYDSTMQAGINFIHAAYGFGTINVEVPKITSFAQLPEVAAKIL